MLCYQGTQVRPSQSLVPGLCTYTGGSYRFGRRFCTMSTARVEYVESQFAEIRRCAVPSETSTRVVIPHVNGHHLSSSHHLSCLTSLIATDVFTSMAVPLEC